MNRPLSELFVSDLKETVATLATRADLEIAWRIGNELLDRALAIGRNPFIGQPVKRRPGARKVLRHSYLIYYDEDEVQRTVEVLRVWHAHRDAKTLRLE